MANWEDRYNDLKSGKIDEEIEVLEEKAKEGKTTREEYEKLAILKKSVENKDKIEKVIEYKDKAEKFLKSIDEELNVRKQLSKLYKQQNALENELQKIQERYDNIQKKMKGLDKSSAEYKALQGELQECVRDIDKNNENFAKQQEGLGALVGRESKFQGRKNSDLRKIALETSSTISKCGIVIENLLDGKNWDAIEYNLSKFKEPTKYTPSKETAKKLEAIEDIPVIYLDDEPKKEGTIEDIPVIYLDDEPKKEDTIVQQPHKTSEFEDVLSDDGTRKEINEKLLNEKNKTKKSWYSKMVDKFKDSWLGKKLLKNEIEGLPEGKLENSIKEEKNNKVKNIKDLEEKVTSKEVKEGIKEEAKEEDLKLDMDFLDRIKVIVDETDKAIPQEPDKQAKYKEYMDKKYENSSKDKGTRGTSKEYKDFVKSQEDDGAR